MKSIIYIAITFLFFVVLAQESVPFPENWEKFNLVEEGEIVKGNPLYAIVPGPHKTYLNDIAFEHFKKYIKDYKAGKNPPPFPEGSMIVFVNFKKEGEPRLILVMHKKKEYGQTGGWGWEGFRMPDKKRIVANADKDCANCHYKGTKDWDGAFFTHWKSEEAREK